MPTVLELLQAAHAAHRAGDFALAEQRYRQVLAADPAQAEVIVNLAMLLVAQSRAGEALPLVDQALRIAPERPAIHAQRGIVLNRLNRSVEAAASFEQAIRLQPGEYSLHFNLGNALRRIGDATRAEAAYRQALVLAPHDTDIHLNLAETLREQGRAAEAAQLLEQALRIRPEFADAWLNLGLLHKTLGNAEQAEACYRQAVQFQPQHAGAWNNLGTLLQSEFQGQEAIDCFRRALAINPRYVTAAANLGDTLLSQGDCRAAIDSYLAAQPWTTDDTLRVKAALALPSIADSVQEIETARARLHAELSTLEAADVRIADPVGGIGVPAFYLAYQGHEDRALQSRIAELLLRASGELAFVAPHCARPSPVAGRRIRIGFVSQYFNAHTIGKLNAGVIRELDRSRFEVTVLRIPGRYDAMSETIDAKADQALMLAPQLEPARQQIAARELDVLFYTDVGLEPMAYYLAFARLAPVQCVTWGHPLTTGIGTLDYFLSSQDLETSAANSHYRETLVRLDHLLPYYFRPAPVVRTLSRADLQLPEHGPLYICPQSLFKLSPADDRQFGEILRQDPSATIVLIAGQQSAWTERVIARQRRTLGSLADRVRFVRRLNRDEFPQLLAMAEVMLDPLCFGGGNTSYEAFAQGIPIVTLPTDFLRGRITYSLYRAMGLDELVAQDAADYVRRAVQLANDTRLREQTRARILGRTDRIFENPAGVRELEAFLLAAVGHS